jgi:exopolyphosphatase / guanosine-5'-triphosphate,3'-diphosphate pyrophosphatase
MSETLAIIDLGTNTFHLLIAEIDEREDFKVTEKHKEPVQLGEGGINSGKIAPQAYQRGLDALKKLQTMMAARNVREVRAFATSAIRSSSNGKEFIQQAKEESGIDIRIINGNEEASLIFDGVRNGVQLPHEQNVLIVDIGGGSVEFIVARDGKAQLLRSLDIGAARLLDKFSPSDPLKVEEVKTIREHLRHSMSGLLDELKQFDIKLLVGSSGTFETISAMIAHRKKDFLSSENLNSYRFSRGDFRQVHQLLLQSDRSAREAIPGMDPMRVEMISMGSMLIDLVLEEVGIKELMVSSFALKEGILYRYIDEQKERIHTFMGNTSRNLRAKAVKNLCEKYHYKKAHVLKVAEIAASIFDQLQPLHPFGRIERELLRYGAMMHDIGHFINRSGHHKHGQYIIMSSGLQGFSHDEVIILGNIVRYHRKSLPTRDHFHFKVLEQKQRLMVRLLAGILRIADHLDRSHRDLVSGVKLSIENKVVRIKVISTAPADMEIESATAEKDLLEGAIDCTVIIQQG